MHLCSFLTIAQQTFGCHLSCAKKQAIINNYKEMLREESATKTVKIVSHISAAPGVATSTVTKPTKNKNVVEQLLVLIIVEGNLVRLQVSFKNQIPTINKMLRELKRPDLSQISCSTLNRFMKQINFKYVKRNRKSILIEMNDIVRWCTKYLRTIQQFRKEGRQIYYLDETWVNEGHTKEKQLQPWDTVPASSAIEQVTGSPIPPKIGGFYQAPRAHPWRPTLGYENLEFLPLTNRPISNKIMDPGFTPHEIASEPLKFPNLVTGFERNPSRATRSALYTRHTPFEWTQHNLQHYSESDIHRNYAERLRGDFIRVMRETDEKTAQGQRESCRRLGERITDTTFWRNEVRTELERLLTETSLLQDSRRAVNKALNDIEAPLHIAQECLYHRENRYGIDLVHDHAEQALLREIEIYRISQERLRAMYTKIQDQLRNNRGSQHELETDVRSKESALGIDHMCHQLSNYTKGINYYAGIEKYDPTVNTIAMWAENSNRIVQRSQNERGKSAQMRSDAENLINEVASEIWDSWNSTNNALARRASETLETKSKLQMHLHKVQQEIFEIEKSIELLKKAIIDKSNPMKVAHTRLEARAHRRDVELCKDTAHDRLVQEVLDIQDSVENLHKKLQDAEVQHQQLLKTRSDLESDLHNKANSLFIDRDKCMGMRRAFPITATIKY